MQSPDEPTPDETSLSKTEEEVHGESDRLSASVLPALPIARGDPDDPDEDKDNPFLGCPQRT